MVERTFYLETYGCQMNLADSELIGGVLASRGYRRVGDPAEADTILLNTCAVREHAEERVLGRIGDLARHKYRRPGVRLAVAGCMAQHLRRRLLERAPQVDLLVGPDAYRRLPELLEAATAEPQLAIERNPEETYADLEPTRAGGVRAWVTAMRGCDRFCTFCIVPFVRGRERSIPGPVLLGEVERLAAGGVREVVYLGQTVTAYNDGRWDFATLLERTARIEGIARIRFTSPHPCDIGDRLIEVMATTPGVCPALHLPVQSGSDRVLARMHRGYTRAEYEALVDRLRAAIPGLALSTDVIVGFPGEEEEDFEATLDLLRRVRFDAAFMFSYSSRPGTAAARWPETISDEEKGERLRAVIALQEAIAAEINRELVGRQVEVLVEGPARRPAGWWSGRTREFKTTVLPGPAAPGELREVTVGAASAHTLLAVGP